MSNESTPGEQISVNTAVNRLNFPIVGIGASAGGIQALLRFFDNAPADMGMAFVVVLHLSPSHESNVDQVLRRATRMPVRQVTESTAIEINHVYIISPSNNLEMRDGYLSVSETDHPRGRPIAIDLFFRSLADVHKERAISILLSGTGSDGAAGIGRIKEQAGVTLVQTPADAEYPEMPQNAIATGQVDFVLPVVDMPQRLIDLHNNARAIQLPGIAVEESAERPISSTAAETERSLRDILTTLRLRTSNDFRRYKRATVLRRIERRLQVNGLTTLPAYLQFLQSNADETSALLKDMLIGVTNFFRDRAAFDAFEREIVPRLFEGKSADDQVRGWSAGCSSGEEVYSLGMLLLEYTGSRSNMPSIQLFASDIDERAIGIARAGIYPESILADVPPTRQRQFFIKDNARYQVIKALREKVLFATHNMLRDPPFSRLDFVSCRNLLIYLDRDAQRQALQAFHFALQSGGFLLLGSSESAEVAEDLFTPVDTRYRIYRAKRISPTLRPTPALHVVHQEEPPRSALPEETATARQSLSLAALHQRALEQYGPPSIIVDQDYDILHMSERVGRYLRYVGGEPSRNLVTLVRPELRLELRTALFQAAQSGGSVDAQQVQLPTGDGATRVNMAVRPFRDDTSDSTFLLVVFDEARDPVLDHAMRDGEVPTNSAVAHLETELNRIKVQLRSTIEQADVSTEELKASNEELQAINEELRSATEELETSKEELQSVNEELITVNGELQAKVEETAKANDDLQNVLAATGIATVFIDRAMRVKRYTPAAAGLFNLIDTDVGRSLLDITHRLVYPELAEDAAETFATLRVTDREVISTDGKWYLARLVPYRTADDRIDGAVLTLTDITPRRRAELELRQNEERLRLAAQSTNDYAIIVKDMDGLIVTWNKGAERVFGYEEKEVIGKPIDLIFLPEDRAAEVPLHERERARADGRAEDERWHVRKDGTQIYCSGVVTFLNETSFKGYAKIVRDLTDRKSSESIQQMQLQLERSMRAQVEEANKAKDEFFAVLSHELKNPLNLIHVKAELLNRSPETRNLAVVQEAANAIRRSVLGQAKIIDDLLDMSRMRTGKLKITYAATDIAAIIRMLADASAVDAAARGITLAVTGTSGPFMMEADPVRVEQMIWNLLSNALKFTPTGGKVTIALTREGNSAVVEIADTGQGIPADFLPRVFEMFSQAEGLQNRSHTGLGIGLSLVRQLAEMHGGRVEARSPGVGQGAVFRLSLPARTTAVEGADGAMLEGSSGSLNEMRILLVDDGIETLEAFRALLEMEGARVHAETDPGAALAAAGENDFDLILSDIAMPVMDGYELISRLRALPRTANVPAIALTGFGRAQDAAKAISAGYDGHLGKPVSLDALLDILGHTLTPGKSVQDTAGRAR